jgi:hypothetical protein
MVHDEAKIPGGAFLENGIWVNAHGEQLSDKQIAIVEGDDAILEAQTNPGKPLEQMNKTELLEHAAGLKAAGLKLEIDPNSTKAVILDAILEAQTNT